VFTAAVRTARLARPWFADVIDASILGGGTSFP